MMKKTIFSFVLLVMALTAGAQTIKVNYQKGDVRKYSAKNELTLGVPMQGEQKGSMSQTYICTITDATADGYVAELKVGDITTDGSYDIIKQLGDGNYINALKETPAQLKLDKNGAVVDVLNSDALLALMSKSAVDEINKQYADNPDLEKNVPKSRALMTVNEFITKDNLLQMARNNTIFSLNGKDFQANPTEEEELYGIFKVKNNYTFSSDGGALTVKSTATSSMTEDETKAFLKKQMSQMSGEEISDNEFNQAWGQMKMMGMTRVSINSKAEAKYDASGWLTTQSGTMNGKFMGASVKVVESVTPME